MATYLENIQIAVNEEIKILEANITKRTLEISNLEKDNEAEQERIKGLSSAKVKLDEALVELSKLNLGSNSSRYLSTDGKKRVPQKKLVFELLTKSSSSGLTYEEIHAAIVSEYGLTLNHGSLRSFLSVAVRHGEIGKQGNRYCRR